MRKRPILSAASNLLCLGVLKAEDGIREYKVTGLQRCALPISRTVRRGARRFESSCQMPGVDQVGFQNPDGEKVLVVTNAGPAQRVTLKQGEKAAELALAADSLTTLTWA